MDHDRPSDSFGIVMSLGATILELELLRELEVKLDCRALERSFECVLDGDVDFRPVECTVSGVHFPLTGVLFIERLFELLRGDGELIPCLPGKGKLTASA